MGKNAGDVINRSFHSWEHVGVELSLVDYFVQ